MKCKKCKSENLVLLESGPHQKLVCGECLAFVKFLSKKDAETFRQIQAINKPLTNEDPTHNCV